MQNNSDSPTKKKLIAQFRKRDPTLTNEDVSRLINSTRRFVDLIRKIQNEPQVQISYKDVRRGNSGITKSVRHINTSIDELPKLSEKQSQPIPEVFRRLSKFIDKKKHGK